MPDFSNWGSIKFSREEEMGSPMDGDPILLNFLLPGQSLALDWVLDKVKEIQHSMGMCYEGFKDQFMMLLTTIEAGHAQYSKSV